MSGTRHPFLHQSPRGGRRAKEKKCRPRAGNLISGEGIRPRIARKRSQDVGNNRKKIKKKRMGSALEKRFLNSQRN